LGVESYFRVYLLNPSHQCSLFHNAHEEKRNGKILIFSLSK
jgi:hypothetical protein